MIIQLESKKTDKYRSLSPLTQNYKSLTNSSQFADKAFTKTLKIKMPMSSTKIEKKKSKIKYSLQQGTRQNCFLQADEDQNNITKSTCFRPSIDYKRTYGNVKYLLQVMHKKVRAKTICEKFYTSNYKLDMSIDSNKGFKGGKLSQYSLFKNMRQKVQQKQLNKTMHRMGMNGNKQQMVLKEEKQQHKLSPLQQFLPYQKQQNKNHRNQIHQDIGKLRKDPNTVKLNTLNASLNIYRKKFNELKKNKFNDDRKESSFM